MQKQVYSGRPLTSNVKCGLRLKHRPKPVNHESSFDLLGFLILTQAANGGGGLSPEAVLRPISCGRVSCFVDQTRHVWCSPNFFFSQKPPALVSHDHIMFGIILAASARCVHVQHTHLRRGSREKLDELMLQGKKVIGEEHITPGLPQRISRQSADHVFMGVFN